MVILPNPCSIKLQTNNNPFPTPALVSNIHRSHNIPIISSSTLKTSYESRSLDRFINPVLQQQPYSSSRRGQLLANHTLTTKDLGVFKTKQNDETLEKEVEIVISRLREVVEKVRDFEMEKLNGRLKGTMSDEDRLLMENTSREIIDKFLKRPVDYLKTGCGDFETKLKDLNLLIRMLEKSCSVSQR